MAKRTRSGAVRKVRRWCAHWFAMTDCFLIAPQRWVRIPPTCVKNRDTTRCLCFWQRMRDSIADLPEANRMERSALRRAARLHRSLAWRWVRIPSTDQKKRHPKVSLSWQRMRDSNPRKRSQSPVCYRYTNPLFVRHSWSPTSNMGIIPRKVKKSSIIFLFFKKTFPQICSVPRHRKCVSKNKEGEKNS